MNKIPPAATALVLVPKGRLGVRTNSRALRAGHQSGCCVIMLVNLVQAYDISRECNFSIMS